MKDLIEALQIFLKYGNPHNPTNCTHDKIEVDIDPELVSDIDIVRLDELGFIVSEDSDESFISFRYGSC